MKILYLISACLFFIWIISFLFLGAAPIIHVLLIIAIVAFILEWINSLPHYLD